MTKKTVLIAGGAGFLGSFLCDAYLKKGYKTICLDNLSTCTDRNISHLLDNPDFVFEKIDITEDIPSNIKNEKYDIVANLASPASPPLYQKLAVETLMVGSVGTLNLLEISKLSKARFFQASTSEVYGDPSVHPQPESYRGNVNCYGPRSMYDEAKRFGEALVYSYREKHGISTVIARFFNTYGPRMDADDGRVVSNFIVQALSSSPITVYGDGSQSRSFCYVDDLIDAITKLIDSDEEGPINLGNPNEFTVLELANLVKELTNSDSKIVYKELPTDDPTQRQPVIDRAKEVLNWEPTTQLKAGLDKTIKYFASIKD